MNTLYLFNGIVLFLSQKNSEYRVPADIKAQAIQQIDLTDDAQFEREFKAHYKRLHYYAIALMNDSDTAEEMVQNVFVKLWQKRDTVNIEQTLEAYLYRSVRNECLNHFKHQKVKSNYQLHVAHRSKNEQEQDSSHKAELSELEKKLDDAIHSLPEQCRLIFQLSRFEDLKYRDIAEELGLSIKTVENQMGKALKILRTQLIDYLPLLILIMLYKSQMLA